jgi:hypothetical protein
MRRSFITIMSVAVTVTTILALVLSAGADFIGPQL